MASPSKSLTRHHPSCLRPDCFTPSCHVSILHPYRLYSERIQSFLAFLGLFSTESVSQSFALTPLAIRAQMAARPECLMAPAARVLDKDEASLRRHKHRQHGPDRWCQQVGHIGLLPRTMLLEHRD